MSFFKRLLSADYRAAVNAEAAGQLDQAAERYALAGEYEHAARVHLARSERASNRATEIAALRDALHWAGDDNELRRQIHIRLGRTLLAKAQAEGIATHTDKQKVREAAEMLMAGGDFEHAGKAFESIDDLQRAAIAYGRGGLVDQMEQVLGKDDERSQKNREVDDAYARYELQLRLGERDEARDALRACVAAAENKAEYRRLLDTLESRLITGGTVVIRRRQGPELILTALSTVVLGRDPLCQMPLRSTGVSRRHAEIAMGAAGDKPRFHLRDLDSRNGTRIGDLPLAGAVPLAGTGTFRLGDHCIVEFAESMQPAQLTVSVRSGLDQGRALIIAGPGEPVDLGPILGVAAALALRDGRPFLKSRAQTPIRLSGEEVAVGEIQLIHGDELLIGDLEVEVE